MIQIHDVDQGTPEWHELRRNLYTGSNAHKLLKYGAIDYARSVPDSNFTGNFYTKRGHILEGECIELYEAITGRSVLRPGFVTNSTYPACGYSPDGLDNNTLLEVKCFNETRHQAITKGQIPLEILAQIHFGLLITGLRKARLILYNPDITDEDGNFDAKRSLIIMPVTATPGIENNFKRILTKE